MTFSRRSGLRMPSPPDDRVIGLMGGSFDPPHSGHAHVIATAKRAAALDCVWVLVSPGNPLKRTQTALGVRVEAARRRLGGPGVVISDIEAAIGTRYTVDLIRALKQRAPRARFVWIIGGDNLRDFHRWKEWRAIARLVPIVVVARPGASPKAGLSRFARLFAAERVKQSDAWTLARRSPPCWAYIAAPFDPVSSSELRAEMAISALPPI